MAVTSVFLAQNLAIEAIQYPLRMSNYCTTIPVTPHLFVFLLHLCSVSSLKDGQF
jgi:hypothetical protein